jgi:aspartate/methionine/tyrosine aminotransferase
MSEEFALGSFLARWGNAAPHNLSASESATLTLADLLALADPEDRRRWQDLALGYADPRGAAWLRAEIAGRRAGLGADAVLVCAGAQEALACAMQSLLAPDDHAIVVVPIYHPSERAVTSICAATGVPLDHRDGLWRLDIDRIAAALRPNTRLVLMNFPNSPTGAALDPAALAALVALCARRGLWLVNDEVYRAMTEDGPPAPPVAALYDRGVSIDAVSKGMGLPGLRVGWIESRDPALLARALRAKSGLSSCIAAPSEVLAHIALRAEAGIVARNRAIARANRGLVRQFLHRHPQQFEGEAAGNLSFAAPRCLGARDATGFAINLVRAAGVLLLPFALWRSSLAEIPTDRIRLGLGGDGVADALAAMEAFLQHGTARAAVA